MSEILPGVPPHGSGVRGWVRFSVAEAGSVCGSRGGNILNGEHLDNLVRALSGDGGGSGKAEGGGLHIAATLFFHEHAVCLQSIVMRKGRKKKKRSDNAILSATNGENPSWICPPQWAERVAGKGIPHAVAAQDNLRGRHKCAEHSPLLRGL